MPNFQNRTLFENDNLPILRALDANTVDLIYLDPPFNSNRNYAAPIGSEAAGAAFKDTWTLSDIDEAEHGELADREPALYAAIHAAGLTHGKSMKSYLIMMGLRMLEIRRVLKETGSIYLHCDPTASHYLKLLMDSVWGKKYVRNEIVWHYSGWNARLSKSFSSRHDIILFYGKSVNQRFNSYALEWESEEEYIRVRRQKVYVDDEGRKYVLSDGGRGKRTRRYLSEAMAYGKPVDDVWEIPKINNLSKERVGYPTQKPLALLERIIQASSNPGDVVLDPFCGCATTCIAAEKLGRQWVGIDISSRAVELVRYRLERELGLDEREGILGTVIHRTDSPQPSKKLPNYRTHKHTLYGQQEGLCNGCRTHFPFRNMTVDHIVAQSQGGSDHLENLQLLCNFCNSVKGTHSQAYLTTRLQEMGIQ